MVWICGRWLAGAESQKNTLKHFQMKLGLEQGRRRRCSSSDALKQFGETIE